jgi:hypothetical protein
MRIEQVTFSCFAGKPWHSQASEHSSRPSTSHGDANLNYGINKDEGHLGGNYGQLEKEDHSIAHQEQMDARQNGGYITTGEQSQLNHEENRLHNQVRKDDTL